MTYDDWLEIEEHLFAVPRDFYNQSLKALQLRHKELAGEEFTSWYHASLMSEYKHAKNEIDELEKAIDRLRNVLGGILVGPSKVTMGHLRFRHLPESLKTKYSVGPEAGELWDSTDTPVPADVIETMDKYLGMSIFLK